jgi:signal transduction histidine kinase
MRLPLRSLYTRVMLLFLGTVLLAFVGVVATSIYVTSQNSRPGSFFAANSRWHLRETLRLMQEQGKPAARQYLDRVNAEYATRYALVGSDFRDIFTGEDLSAHRNAPLSGSSIRPPLPPLPNGPPLVIRHRSPDGRYEFLHFPRANANVGSVLPWYSWIPIAVLVLGWMFAFRIVGTLRQLRDAVSRFGSGDLSARSGLTRRDEIGDLSRAIDRMAERIETLLTAERRLLQDISHELRSPLARMRFALELARKEPTPSAFNRIEREIRQLTLMVDELIEVTRAEGDPGSRSMESFHLGEMLADVVEDCGMEAEIRLIDIHLRGEYDFNISGDRRLLRRAVENVVRNAIRHSPEETSIEVQAERSNNNLRITIRDYGNGVDEAHLTEIFRPFFRKEEDRSRDSGGVGLGLSIVQRAVHLHHGHVRAANAKPGLRVEIELPA